MENQKIIERTLSLTLNLNEVAKAFDYKLEVDSYSDIHHSGYSAANVRNMKLSLPKGLDQADVLFPNEIGRAMESAERDSLAAATRKSNIEDLKSALEKIDLSGGGADYQNSEGQSVSAKAGITSVEVNEKEETITVTIHNPEHLINSVVNGVGMFYPDLSSSEPSTDAEIKNRFHYLARFFDVYGERKPSSDNNSSPEIDEDFFKSEAEFYIEELSVEEVAAKVIEAVDLELIEPKVAVELAAKLTKKGVAEVKSAVLSEISSSGQFWEKSLA